MIPHQTVSTSTSLCVTSNNMKSSSHKTWQTLLLFLKLLQIQNLKRKIWGDIAYYIPIPHRLKKWGTRPLYPPPNCAHACNTTRYKNAKHVFINKYIGISSYNVCCKISLQKNKSKKSCSNARMALKRWRE